VSGEPLVTLRRVTGVLGSFVCGPQGQLLLLDLPQGVDLPALERTTARLMNLLQTAVETLPCSHTLRLRFATADLVATRLRYGLLCVLADTTRDDELLAVAMQTLARRLSAASS
jgi:predicted regulator of Ras-like GTPase activity (Roadblock/LC7/MglB family)